MHSYVFSRTLDKIKRKGVTLVKDDPGEFVRGLKERDGKDICVLGGGDLGRSLLAAGVVDEVGASAQEPLASAAEIKTAAKRNVRRLNFIFELRVEGELH